MKRRCGLLALFFLGSVVAAGCGGSAKLYPVEGTVTIDGNPLEGATVTFTNEGASATGLTSAAGKFKLLTAGKEGAPAGTYKVIVTKVENKAAGISPEVMEKDPTQAMQQFAKATGPGKGGKGGAPPAPKSEIPERYGKPGAIPDQVVPASGPIPIELKSK